MTLSMLLPLQCSPPAVLDIELFLLVRCHVTLSMLLPPTVLDICKHIELYQTMLRLVSSLARNPATQHLLTLPVFSAGGAEQGVTSLSSLVAKLRDIAIIYQRTAR